MFEAQPFSSSGHRAALADNNATVWLSSPVIPLQTHTELRNTEERRSSRGLRVWKYPETRFALFRVKHFLMKWSQPVGDKHTCVRSRTDALPAKFKDWKSPRCRCCGLIGNTNHCEFAGACRDYSSESRDCNALNAGKKARTPYAFKGALYFTTSLF